MVCQVPALGLGREKRPAKASVDEGLMVYFVAMTHSLLLSAMYSPKKRSESPLV